MENTNQKLTSFGVILGLSIIISFGLASYTFYTLRSTDFITTTGSAKKEVTSDKVKWTSNITRVVKLSTVKDGYVKLDADLKEVKNFLATSGIPVEQIDIS